MSVRDAAGVRFLCLTAHVVLLITLLIDTEEAVLSSLPLQASSHQRHSAKTQLVIAVSSSLGLAGLELLGLVSGASILAPLTAVVSSLCHGVGAICLSFALLDAWPVGLHWLLLGLCSVPPAVMEVAVILGLWLRKTV